jgi:hypothetical protein
MVQCSMQMPIITAKRQHSAAGFYVRAGAPMLFSLPQVLRNIMGLSSPHDEHLLAGADEESLQELGVSQPVLSQFQQDVAVQCPDLVHEAQMSFARK